MSGRGGGSNSGVFALASALGIQRNELGSFSSVTASVSTQFPKLHVQPLPLPCDDESMCEAELKRDLLARFRQSPFHLEKPTDSSDITRYTDKYKKSDKEKWTPDWSLLPKELRWDRKKAVTTPGEPPKKRKRFTGSSTGTSEEAIAKKLSTLEAEEKSAKKLEGSEAEKEATATADGAEETSDKEDAAANDDEATALSDDDYLEEDNDYIQCYFDNGENYADASDDNLDDDAVF